MRIVTSPNVIDILRGDKIKYQNWIADAECSPAMMDFIMRFDNLEYPDLVLGRCPEKIQPIK
jgi:hypothetical protein